MMEVDNEDIFLYEPQEESFYKKIDEDLDFAFAVSLQAQFDSEINENNLNKFPTEISNNGTQIKNKPLCIVDGEWELIDPNPDIHGLFLQFDDKFFYGKLKGIEIKWSPRMTLCAGVCSYEGRGGLCSIRLSLPLLKLRPRRDLVETLLHEMIHAYLFVTQNNKDRESHGPEFLSHMSRINKEAGTRITVYHSFHDEVDLYRTHWWKCSGPCQKWKPYFGIVKRAMNRAPGPSDPWWNEHKSKCGGIFMKIKEPDSYKKKGSKRKPPSNAAQKDIRGFLPERSLSSSSSSNSSKKQKHPSEIHTIKSLFLSENNHVQLNQKGSENSLPSFASDLSKKGIIPFRGQGHKLGSLVSNNSAAKPISYLVNGYSTHSEFKSKGKINVSRKNSVTFTVSEASNVPRSSDPVTGNGSSSATSFVTKDQHPCFQTSRKFSQSSIESFLLSSPAEKYSQENFLQKKSNQKENQRGNRSGDEKNSFSKIACPVCFEMIESSKINIHLDSCLL